MYIVSFFKKLASIAAFLAIMAGVISPNTAYAVTPMPYVETRPVSISALGATINGYVNPYATTDTQHWFEWGPTPLYGTKTAPRLQPPAASTFSETLTNLTPGTTYYFIAVAENAGGKTGGVRDHFVAPPVAQQQPPEVITNSAASITANSAVLNGSADPKDSSDTKHWFEWGTSTSLGNLTTPTPHGLTPANFSETLQGLSPNTIYYFRAVAQNSAGTVSGGILSFKTTSTPAPTPQYPYVTTYGASSIYKNSALLNGYVNPSSTTDTVVWFEYGLTTSMGAQTSHQAAGYLAANFNIQIAGLTSNTIYYFRAVAQNSAGTVYGSIMNFTTLSEAPTLTPYISTWAATSISDHGAQINGYLDPNGTSDTVRWFEWGTTASFGNTTIQAWQFSPGAIAEMLNTLTPNTTYYFRAVARNSAGTVYGSTLTFLTSRTATEPTAVTQSPTFVTESTAILNGLAIADTSVSTDAWFEWGLTPSFGVQTQRKTIGVVTSSPFADSLIRLLPNTLYYYRAAAQNQNGIGYGSVISFRTASAQPAPASTPSPTSLSPASPTSGSGKSVLSNITITKEAYNPMSPDCRTTDCTAAAGDTIQYSIHIRNVGSTDVTNVIVKDAISPYVDYVSSSDGGVYNSETREAVWTFPQIRAGEVKGVVSNVRVKKFLQDAEIKNTASVVLGTLSKQSNTVIIRMSAADGMKENSSVILNITASEDNVSPGQTVRYTVHYENRGASLLSNAILTFTLPAELAYEQLITAHPNDAKAAMFTGQQITLPVGDIDAGQQGGVILVVSVKKGTPDKTILATVATMDYTDSLTGMPGEVNVPVHTTVSTSGGFASLFAGYNGWLLSLILGLLSIVGLLIIILLIQTLMRRRKEDKRSPHPYWGDMSDMPPPGGTNMRGN